MSDGTDDPKPPKPPGDWPAGVSVRPGEPKPPRLPDSAAILAVPAATGINLRRAKREARGRGPAKELTGRQITFVALVAQGLPAREAARLAGFDPNHGRTLVANPRIAAGIEAARRACPDPATGRPRGEGVPASVLLDGAPRRRGPGRPRKSGASSLYPGVEPTATSPGGFGPGPHMLDPDARPPATRFLDGFSASTGALATGSVTSGERDVAIRLARDLSTCTFEEVARRWDASARNEAETIMDRPWSPDATRPERPCILPPTHNPIYFLAERCWFDNVLTDPRFLFAPYHRDRMLAPIMDYILAAKPDAAGILFLGPRFTYKTTFSHGAIPQWYAFRGAHLDGRHYSIVLRHHKLELAADNLIRLKSKFQSHPWVRAVWRPACPDEGVRDFGTMQRFTLPWVPPGQTADPSFRAIGLGASDTGRHPDLDMGDDLVTEEHLSKVVRDEAKRRYRAKRYQLDIDTGREVNTGTPYHRMDLWATMMNATIDGRPMYRVHQIPAHLPPELGGGLAHPFKLSEESLERRRQEELASAGNDDFYYLQFEVTYRLSRQQTTEAWWLRDARREDIPEDGLPIITVDPAWKGDKNYGEGDSAAIQVWVLARRGPAVLRYLVDGVHSNEMSPSDGEREILRLMSRYGVVVVAPELSQGSTFRQNLVQSAASLGQRLVIADLETTRLGKPDRIGGFLKECEAGRVFLCRDCDPVVLEEFRSQFNNWPQVDHDDALDAAAYTCDPGITKAWAPAWGAAVPRRPWLVRESEPEELRTRYSGL